MAKGILAVAVVMAVAVMASAAMALPLEQAVMGSGMEKMEVLPDEMRMKVETNVTAATMEEAFAAYAAKKDELTKALTEAGAVPESIKVSEPSPGARKESEKDKIMARMMAAQQKPGEEKKPAAAKETVSYSVQAAWKLAGQSVEALYAETSAIEKKAGAMEFLKKEALTPEEQEEMEEGDGEGESRGYYNDGREEMKPGKTFFAYAKKIAPEKVTEIKKAAFAKARKTAADTAALAGRELGELVSLNAAVQAGRGDDEQDYYRMMRVQMMMGAYGGGEAEDEVVAVGDTLAMLPVRVTVATGYSFK